jgi:hypothetical protein
MAVDLDAAKSAVLTHSMGMFAPGKALYIVNLANYEHPDSCIMVTYTQVEMADHLKRLFSTGWVNGDERRGARQVFQVMGGKDQEKEVSSFLAAVEEAELKQSTMPVLLGQTTVMSEGWDGIQVRSSKQKP